MVAMRKRTATAPRAMNEKPKSYSSTRETTPTPPLKRRGSRSRKKQKMAKFLIVEARFYDHLNDMLIAGATEALKAAGHEHEVLTVPGALEIPGAISLAIDSDLYDGFVAIGVVIRGETYHFEIVAGESARGLMALSMDGAAIGNGIITVENEEQALARADKTRKNKGGEAAQAAIAMYELGLKFSH